MAKQPWYMPFFWPLGHVTNAIKLSVSETLEPLEAGHLHYIFASPKLKFLLHHGKIRLERSLENVGVLVPF